jgi:hypothetical protein
MAKKIYFSRYDNTEAVYNPTPASKLIPEWYKNAKSYLNNEKKPSIDEAFITIKKCVPVFDSMTAGYLILLGRDLYCEQTETGPFFHWRTEGDEESGKVLTQHVDFQVQGHPDNTLGHQLKIENQWIIKTEPGYSCLITPPMHRDNQIVVLSAIVDTDKYYEKINLPFNLKNDKFEGMIEAGTPIAQVIPFKRESHKMEVVPLDEKRSLNNKRVVSAKLFDAYRNLFWSRKEYK